MQTNFRHGFQQIKLNLFILLICFSMLTVIRAEVYDGLILFTPSPLNPQAGNSTYLIDGESNIINQWNHPNRVASMAYLLPDSTMLYPCLAPNTYMSVAAGGGRILKYNWDGEILWDFNWSSMGFIQHHDIEPLPNGNILLLSNERISMQEAIDRGRIEIEGEIWPDMVVEIEPTGPLTGQVVWQWRFWDHLIQDVDSTLENHGTVSEHPERLDINVANIFGVSVTGDYSGDWTHANAVHYNKTLDQIIISCRRTNEFYVIDHSTTTEQASGTTGGNSGKGGDFLYRWGNPQNYDRGDSTNQITFAQHSVNWIPEGYPGAGNILIFNNGFTQLLLNENDRSSVIEITPPMNNLNEYIIENDDAYGPDEFEWFYNGGDDFNFISVIQGGAFRLPNGNTLITTAGNPTIFEVNQNGEMEWSTDMGSTGIARAQKYGDEFFNSHIWGDVNQDGIVNANDILLMVNIILGLNNTQENADLNSDNLINILDIFILIDIIITN